MRAKLLLLLAFAVSALAHPALTCRSCHVDVQQHAAALCGRCHTREQSSFATSAHAASKSVNCVTCHGSHTMATAKQIEQRCLACHLDSPMFSLGGTASCTSCHSPHSGE